MSRKASKQVSLSPDVHQRPTVGLEHGGNTRRTGNKERVVGILAFRLSKSSSFPPARLLRRLGAKVARVLCCLSMPRKCSRKVSSSNLVRSRSLAESIDSHRAEAIEDCIEFLNSSSSLHSSQERMCK